MSTNLNRFLIVAAVLLVLVAGFWWWASTTSIYIPWLPFGSKNVGAEHVATTTGEEPAQGGVPRTTRANSDVASIVSTIPEASRFATLFVSTGVRSQVSGNGPYTIFVPTNSAFTQLSPGTLENMNAADRKRMVQYHVVPGRAIDTDALESGNIEALSKDMLNFDVRDPDEIARVNSAIIMQAYNGKNGVVYLVNNVLVPPER